MHKKKWQQPKLIVLARSSPQESVLVGCKGGSDGPTISVDSCRVDIEGVCWGNCSSFSGRS